MKNKENLYNMGMGFLFPEIVALAKAIAVRIPESHWLRSPITNRVLGVLAAHVRNQSYTSSSPLKATLARSGARLVRRTANELRSSPAKSTSENLLDQNWVREFFQDGCERLKNAGDANAKFMKMAEVLEGEKDPTIALGALVLLIATFREFEGQELIDGQTFVTEMTEIARSVGRERLESLRDIKGVAEKDIRIAALAEIKKSKRELKLGALLFLAIL